MSAARTAPTAPVRHARQGPLAVPTMDRPAHREARNPAVAYELEEPFHRAAGDDEAEDRQGRRSGTDAKSGPHHRACAQDAVTGGDAPGGTDLRAVKKAEA
ncbi:hypothetical protein AB0F36_16745 [Streptomyces sp. NPDC029080]|uniref:hypothetical protein n=1 Tax=Streptomyces sp. NPDC029080 TaxID=3155017 RepID=UPI0033C48939